VARARALAVATRSARGVSRKAVPVGKTSPVTGWSAAAVAAARTSG